jgi:hypothetical protein
MRSTTPEYLLAFFAPPVTLRANEASFFFPPSLNYICIIYLHISHTRRGGQTKVSFCKMPRDRVFST